jgi:hypothetical protein
MDDAILIAAYLSQEKAKKQRSMVDQAKLMLHHARLLKMRMYLKPRHFLHATISIVQKCLGGALVRNVSSRQ